MTPIEQFMVGLAKNLKTRGYGIVGEFKLWMETSKELPATVYVQWNGYETSKFIYTIRYEGAISTKLL